MIKYIQGDILDPSLDLGVLVHGCNCFHTMKSGVAKVIAERYPEAAAVDKLTSYGDRSKLGSISVASAGDDEHSPLIVNGYIEFNYGREPGHRYVSYDALVQVMEAVKDIVKDDTETRIGLPKIGAGLGGGDWLIIEAIINSVFKDREIIVVTLN